LWFNQIIEGWFTYVMKKTFFAAVVGSLCVAGVISRMVKDIAARGKTT
jgi:outer membrane murein-binding lipoprotein Lpp